MYFVLSALPSMVMAEQQPLLLDQEDAAGRRPHPDEEGSLSTVNHAYINPARRQTRRFLESKYGHYAVLLLVSLDVSCIFADFLISLYKCDLSCKHGKPVPQGFNDAQSALGIISLVFSCLFMVELVASIWAFGLRSE